MEKLKWTKKPVTWGGYITLCAVCYAISMMMCLCYYVAWFEPTWWTRMKESVKDCLKKITDKE